MKTVFDTLPNMDEFFVGASESLDRMMDSLGSIHASDRGYPPYNIVVEEETDQGRVYVIQIAVAGFKQGDLKVSLRETDTMMPKLEVEGISNQKDPKVQLGDTLVSRFQYRGIASRQFVRRFILERGTKVTKVKLADGILNITLLNPTTVHRDSVERLKIE